MSDKVSVVIKYKNKQTNTFYNVLEKNYTKKQLNDFINFIDKSQNYPIKNREYFDAVICVEK